MQKILFFTAGPKATTVEIQAIADLNTHAAQPYEISVLDGSKAANAYGAGRLMPCDLVAGTVPAAYNAKTVAPDFSKRATVTDAQEIEITGGTVAFTIVGGVITGGAFTATP